MDVECTIFDHIVLVLGILLILGYDIWAYVTNYNYTREVANECWKEKAENAKRNYRKLKRIFK